MTITISPALESKLRQNAHVEGISIDAYIERLIQEDEDWAERFEGPSNEGDPEFIEIRAAVMEGLEQAERGEAVSAKDILAELRAKHGVPR